MCFECDYPQGCDCYCNDLELQEVIYSPHRQIQVGYCDTCKHSVYIVIYHD